MFSAKVAYALKSSKRFLDNLDKKETNNNPVFNDRTGGSMEAVQDGLGFSIEATLEKTKNLFTKKTPRAKKADTLTTAETPNPAVTSQTQEITEMAKKAQDVLSFFKDSSGIYMRHFFMFTGDVPVFTEVKTAPRDKTKYPMGKVKTTVTTKRGKISLTSIDKINEKYEVWGGKKTIEDCFAAVLDKPVIDALEAEKVDLKSLISWAEDVKSKIKANPKKSSPAVDEATKKENRKIREYSGLLAGLSPNITPKELVTLFKEMAADDATLNKAVTALTEAVKINGRDKNGYIKLRDRKPKK